MPSLRIAMIGAGHMAGRVHYPSLVSFPDVELAAVCDLDPGRLEQMAETYNIPGRYSDYQRMVDEVAPDAVYAIGPPHIMFDIWVWLLERGVHLCIEKPMGITLHQARILAHLADQHGCITQVSLQRRASPLGVKLREACVAQGPIYHAVCEFYKAGPKPYMQARDHMMDDGVHAIDTLRWICGGEVAEVQSTARRLGTPDINHFTALLHFDNGATGVLMNNWASGRRIFRVGMHAPGICAESELEQEGVVYTGGDATGVRFSAHAVAESDEFYIYGGFQAKNRHFIDAVQAGVQPESCFADALKTMEVAETILAQATLRGG